MRPESLSKNLVEAFGQSRITAVEKWEPGALPFEELWSIVLERSFDGTPHALFVGNVMSPSGLSDAPLEMFGQVQAHLVPPPR
ncbi:hypothetical protein [Sphaerisporangium flaviroseum]|uniref:hypothetical protein n=1 Tax=Sphaerisporangium flaviroseum TaxID=509199 RepID=UPI0031E62B8F